MSLRCTDITAVLFLFTWPLHVAFLSFSAAPLLAEEIPGTAVERRDQAPVPPPETRKSEPPQSATQQEQKTPPLDEEPRAETAERKPTKKQEEENRQKEAEEAKRLTELFLRQQSVFIRKGEFMIEFDPTYNRNSRTEVVLGPTGQVAANVTRRFFDNTMIARYGLLTDGLEVDVIAPVYVHAEQITDLGGPRTSIEEEGFGDLAGAIRYQVWYEKGSRPSLILDAEGKSRTGGTGLKGTGTWNAGGGITLVKTIDPVVFFGRVGYTYNFASHDRDLGNIIDYRLGMGFSLNDRVSFNMQLTGAVIEPSQITTVALTGGSGGGGFGPFVLSSRRVEIMNLVFTTTVLVTKKLFLEPFAGVGLTEQSFSIVGLRIPYRF